MKWFSSICLMLLAAASASAQSYDVWFPINTAVEVPLNIVPLTADGAAPDTGFVYNDTGVSLTATCLADGGTAPTSTAITMTTAGVHDLTHLANGMYKVEIPATGGNKANNAVQTCVLTVEADSILIARSPVIRFDIPGSRGANTWIRGQIGATTNSTTNLDLDAPAGYGDDTFNNAKIIVHDNSGGISTVCSISDYTATNTQAALDCTLPYTPEDSVDWYIVTTEVFANAPTNFDLFSVDGNGRVDVSQIQGTAATGVLYQAYATAQSGTASTIVLAAAESFADDELNNSVIRIMSGTGAGQSRLITDYAGATDTATVSPNWTTNPGATSVYAVLDGLSNPIDPLVYLPTNTAVANPGIFLYPYDSNGDLTKSAATPSCEISLDGAAFAALDTPNMTEHEATTGAYWEFDLIQAETNGARAVIICTASGMEPQAIQIEFQR